MASKKPKSPDPAGLFAHDLELGSDSVAGTDEAGRGCLAGPIVAAAVKFDRRRLEDFGGGLLEGLDDSKRMTAKARERLYPRILRSAAKVSVVARSSRYIDAHGLHVSNIECLSTALLGIEADPGTICLVDGFALSGAAVAHRKLVKGDRTSAAVAAASVVAKVSRDRYMRRAATLYPQYGFESHKGYASVAHRESIVAHGPSPIHRMSFGSAAYEAA